MKTEKKIDGWCIFTRGTDLLASGFVWGDEGFALGQCTVGDEVRPVRIVPATEPTAAEVIAEMYQLVKPYAYGCTAISRDEIEDKLNEIRGRS